MPVHKTDRVEAARKAITSYKGKAPASDTPAKPKERVKGSDTNPKGSASSANASIRMSQASEKGLAAKAEAFKRETGKSVSVGTLKSVMRRGMGAFSQSHSPVVRSREQWGMARVNAFLRLKKSGKPDNPKYTQDNDLL
jgi:hypothetical protein